MRIIFWLNCQSRRFTTEMPQKEQEESSTARILL